ncbi:hypothetical protein [Streptomyces sp. AC550_RSS872]|uniref:hypothetical protein n=1 Tax=Streptomyces sp. AC550_RSS872 TaxID=2823689 RepID=UPI001C272C9C|nr:hypothetical protein [Streptomyces sp. AC550_RSS872]
MLASGLGAELGRPELCAGVATGTGSGLCAELGTGTEPGFGAGLPESAADMSWAGSGTEP